MLFTVCLHTFFYGRSLPLRLAAGWCPACTVSLVSADIDPAAESTIRAFWLYMRSRQRLTTPSLTQPWMIKWLVATQLTHDLVEKADARWTLCLARTLGCELGGGDQGRNWRVVTEGPLERRRLRAGGNVIMGRRVLGRVEDWDVARRALAETVEWARGFRLGLEEW